MTQPNEGLYEIRYFHDNGAGNIWRNAYSEIINICMLRSDKVWLRDYVNHVDIMGEDVSPDYLNIYVRIVTYA